MKALSQVCLSERHQHIGAGVRKACYVLVVEDMHNMSRNTGFSNLVAELGKKARKQLE